MPVPQPAGVPRSRQLRQRTPANADRVEGGFSAGKLVFKVTPYDAASSAIPMRIDCWCAADVLEQTLVFSLGPDRVPEGAGCAR